MPKGFIFLFLFLLLLAASLFLLSNRAEQGPTQVIEYEVNATNEAR